jgi:uncharacterized C2H2 Zn-finger protein
MQSLEKHLTLHTTGLGCEQSHSTNNLDDIIDKSSSSQRPHLEATSYASDVAGYLESRKMTSKDIGGSRYSIAELLSPKNTPPPVEGCTGKETQGYGILQCQLCNKVFEQADNLSKHRFESHAEVFHCRHCSEFFYSSAGLTRHENKVHPEQSYQSHREKF